jgi:hypothetical protein
MLWKPKTICIWISVENQLRPICMLSMSSFSAKLDITLVYVKYSDMNMSTILIPSVKEI